MLHNTSPVQKPPNQNSISVYRIQRADYQAYWCLRARAEPFMSKSTTSYSCLPMGVVVAAAAAVVVVGVRYGIKWMKGP